MSRAHVILRRFDRKLREQHACALVGEDHRGGDDGARVPGLDDSKELSSDERAELVVVIQGAARAIGVSFVGPRRIDAVNIRQASLLAMRRAILRAARRLSRTATPETGACLVLVDGLDTVPGIDWPQQALIAGDGRSLAIAAASVVAKTVRDGFMTRLALDYPDYGFERNKGYGTPEHLDALISRGPCTWHRYSYAPVAQGVLFPV